MKNPSRKFPYSDPHADTVKPFFFACPFFREFREPDKFAKITGRKNLNTVVFQCSRKQKRQNYGVQNNEIDSNAKIKGFTVTSKIQ